MNSPHSYFPPPTYFEEARLTLLSVAEIGYANACQPIPRGRAELETAQQLGADGGQLVAARGRSVGGEAAGGGLKIAGAQLDRHRAADHLAVVQSGPEFLRLAADVTLHLFQCDVLREGVLARPRFAFVIGDD